MPLFIARLADLGIDVEPVIHELGLPPEVMGMREIDVPLAVIHAVSDRAEALTGDPMFGLHVVSWLPRGAYGLLEFIVRSARDVREAATRLVRYNAMLNDMATLSFADDGTEGVMTHGIRGEPLAVGRHVNELVIGMMVRVLRESMADPRWSPRRVWFAHPAPADPAPITAWFGTEISFGHGHNELAVASEALAQPLRSADSALLAVLDEQAMRLLAAGTGGLDDLWLKLRETIRLALRDGAPSLDDVAHTMGTTPRTLQRRLEERATTFSAVIDEIRRDLATMYVEGGALGDVEIAFLLGYGERRAFVRAFKRWTGATPAAFRLRVGARP